MELAKRFQLSLYDANIVASALIAGSEQLFSEDMQSGMTIATVQIRNPFK